MWPLNHRALYYRRYSYIIPQLARFPIMMWQQKYFIFKTKLAICYLMSNLTHFANCDKKISVLQNVLASWGDNLRESPIIQSSWGKCSLPCHLAHNSIAHMIDSKLTRCWVKKSKKVHIKILSPQQLRQKEFYNIAARTRISRQLRQSFDRHARLGARWQDLLFSR